MEEPKVRAVFDRIWAEIDPANEFPPIGYARLLRMPWVAPRIVCTAAAIAVPLQRKTAPRFVPSDIEVSGDAATYTEESLGAAEHFFVSALLGGVAGPYAGDQVERWIWWDMPSDIGHELFFGEPRDALRDMLRRHGHVHPQGLAFGAATRKFGRNWGHRTARGAPAVPPSPLSTSAAMGKAPFDV